LLDPMCPQFCHNVADKATVRPRPLLGSL
jgi:hypothetical protein